MPLPTRRRFLCAAAGLGAVAVLPAGLVWLRRPHPAASVAPARTFRQDGYALGTAVSIIVVHTDPHAAQNALAAAFDELHTVEQIMSIYLPDSQLSRLNRAGFLDHPHPYLLSVLRESQALAQRTRGAFDVTVQPLWDLYAETYRAGHRPTPAQITAALARVDYCRLDITPDRIALRTPNMAITLNGIAQGFAADRVMAVVQQHGITQALVNAGEIGPLGHNPNDRPWRVGIQHPRQPNAYIALADLDGRGLSTSGDYQTTFTPDFRDNHIFDPATGYSPTAFSSVSVVAASTTQADGLSTAVFVLGPEKGRDLLLAAHADALFVLKDGTVLTTPGFPRVNT